ncbi:MAG: prepilin-type N-terminal cleavage/methylation domain-containing protein [Phycisphaeraceae bacterium]|nr:prepilin-type N-terminal cleavage/methylation domain-containing protein [Phycisphaeraceae bacterium]
MSHSRTNRRRPGFTLTELLVSIAAIALLTAGIGRIFRSVGGLVAIGSAESEVNQIARALEKQLRDDFEGFNRMQPGETFLAIRMREIGDLDRDGVLDTGDGEVALYLTARDRDADRNDINNGLINGPYDPDGGRAVTRRVDELMFIANSGSDGYTSYQLDPDFNTPLALNARIYYGHGLRPVPDPAWPPADLDDLGARSGPERWYIPDGDFGISPNPSVGSGDARLTDNRFENISDVPAYDTATGLNEFAGRWTLCRQPLLLYGGDAADYPMGGVFSRDTGIGIRREFAPYIRDLETEQRVNLMDNQIRNDTDLEDDNFMLADRSNYRRIRDGRVDVCAQTALDVRSWIEGANPAALNSTGRPFSSGRLLNIQGADAMDPSTANNPLWLRTGNEALDLPALQRAIAGMFTRLQIEPSPPVIVRSPKPMIDTPQPEDALMDLHAVLATNCSNFEVAWSDGSTATDDIVVGGETVVRRGETLWFDIRPLNKQGAVQVRSLYDNWEPLEAQGLVNLQADTQRRLTWKQSELSPMSLSTDSGYESFINTARLDDSIGDATSMTGSGGTPPDATQGPVYSALLTGGASDPDNEALVIFPFRKPSGSGYGDAWDKTILLRIRVTLHDSLGRLPSGKDFEFIFSLDPQGY